MGDDNDLGVARTLGNIEALLKRNGEDFRELSTRLFGNSGDGGIVGAHNLRLQKLETWVVRVATGIAVWVFMTGAGPVSLSSVLQLLHKP